MDISSSGLSTILQESDSTDSDTHMEHESPCGEDSSQRQQSIPTTRTSTPDGWDRLLCSIPTKPEWPYEPADFARQDPEPDARFYHLPRRVHHIGAEARQTLEEYYAHVLPATGQLLDLCSSWVSHYPYSPETIRQGGCLKITGLGMNLAELNENEMLNHGRIKWDLNQNPRLEDDLLDATTLSLGIEYLTRPGEVLSSVRAVTKPGGRIHIAISDRMFCSKAITKWLTLSEEARLEMVGDYLHFSGWDEIEVLQLVDAQTPPPLSPSEDDGSSWHRI
ncbi:hypothetical protein G7054_g515 [Neopestalotiopsis clavispora]|nr:hypothetical protein G7054_g515 [Neopestalotiopsis clavispora]